MRFTVLVDDREGNKSCTPEHGLSLYIEVDDKKILLDNGQSDAFIKNAKELALDIDLVDIIVLSHGHYDHGNGFKHLGGSKTVICHPNSFTSRFSLRTKEFGGINMSKQELESKFNLITSREPYSIAEDVFYIGEIPRENDFESKSFPTVLDDGSIDMVEDDSGIVTRTEKGIVVISGCAHAGICNTIEYAKQITKEDKVYAVIGGFHLKLINEQLKNTIEYFRENNIQKIYLGHCTSDEVCMEIKDKMKDISTVEVMGAGLQYEL